MRRAVAVVAAISAFAALAACGIQADNNPRDIPDELVLTSIVAEGDSAVGGDRIYLIGPGEEQRLRSVARDASNRQALMESLFLGPNVAEIEQQLFTSIPTDTVVNETRAFGGMLQIDTSAELTELSGDALVRALAQIVYTATGMEGITTVDITVEGREIAWPKANGETTTDALRIYDYPNAAESTQPAYPALPLDG